MELNKETFRKIGTLGGSIKINPNTRRYYAGGGNMTKEKLFGVHGPLLIGMPEPSSKEEDVALKLNVSDTRATLRRELMQQNDMSSREADALINKLISSGKLVEITFSGEKVLVWR